MRNVRRSIGAMVAEAARSFPAVVITGPRRAGKTTLLRQLFPRAGYVLLEDPDIVARVAADPRALLDELRLPVILDEIQNSPQLFAYIRARIDRNPREMGRWLITGSQEEPLMQGVVESMAGRASVFQLLPFSLSESPKVSMLRGGYPEVLARPANSAMWMSSYIQTYLERDVRAITNVRDLASFRRFLAMLASRHGQVLNKSDIAAPLGVTVPTLTAWIDILEIIGQIIVVQPYHENFGKRLIKSPKVYIGDPGLACYLLGIRTQAELDRSPFLGPLFEGFVASEILKSQVNEGRRKELYFFRDQQGLEVDFLFPDRHGALWMAECKAAKTVHPAMAKPMISLRDAMSGPVPPRLTVVHRKSSAPPMRALFPGVEALDVESFSEALAAPPKRGGRTPKPRLVRTAGG